MYKFSSLSEFLGGNFNDFGWWSAEKERLGNGETGRKTTKKSFKKDYPGIQAEKCRKTTEKNFKKDFLGIQEG